MARAVSHAAGKLSALLINNAYDIQRFEAVLYSHHTGRKQARLAFNDRITRTGIHDQSSAHSRCVNNPASLSSKPSGWDEQCAHFFIGEDPIQHTGH